MEGCIFAEVLITLIICNIAVQKIFDIHYCFLLESCLPLRALLSRMILFRIFVKRLANQMFIFKSKKMKRVDFNFAHSAQGVMLNEEKPAACGAACGASDKPAACGSACGTGDKPEEKPAACGSACGAGDKPEEKPAACGSACGAGEK